MDKNIQEALKWIYASLGGDISALANVNDVTAILNAIADLDTVQKIKSATELPDVSDVDDGDVLTVVDGEWAKAEPSGGGSSLPSVSSTDNGDVLTVVNGAWDKAASTGLPAVTSSDIGRGLSVQRVYHAGAGVIAPQQTITVNVESGGVLSNTNPSLFTVGASCAMTLTVNGDSETAYGDIIEDEETGDIYADMLFPTLGFYAYPGYGNGVFSLWLDGDYGENITVTVTINTATVVGEWAKDRYMVGYDAVFDFYNGVVVYGDYDTVYAALEAAPVNFISLCGFQRIIKTNHPDYFGITPVYAALDPNGYIRIMVSASEYWAWRSNGTIEYLD